MLSPNLYDPRVTLSVTPMHWTQMAVVAITVGLTGLDGFDVLAISFASPGIAAEWHIDRAALGIVLSMELLGMAFGSIVLGRLADRAGRRPLMLICLSLMSVGMFLATVARDPAELSAWRLLTGLGIGGMLATTNAVASEFSNSARRELSISLMGIGYPLGALLGGLVAATLLKAHGWRCVFYFGASATAALIPIVILGIPESVIWLIARRPKSVLERVNKSSGRLHRDPLYSMPVLPRALKEPNGNSLFSSELRSFTVLATIAYSLHTFTFYYILKWIPYIVVNMGFPPSEAAGVLVWTNVGGVSGAVMFGLIARRVGLRPLTCILTILSFAMVVLFGRSAPDLIHLSAVCAGAGFTITAGIVGLYGIFARGFPPQARASGTGFGIGVGRGASVIAPIAAGVLFKAVTGSRRFPRRWPSALSFRLQH